MRFPLSRAMGPLTTLVFLFVIGGWWVTRAPRAPRTDADAPHAADGHAGNDSQRPSRTPEPSGSPPSITAPAASHIKPPDQILLATFHLQAFGASKTQQPEVMAVLADILRRFDVIALQDIRSPDDAVLDPLIAQVNVAGARYQAMLGPRLGRPGAPQQYAFVWDTRRVRLVPGSGYTVSDEAELMDFEPLVASFEVNPTAASRGTPFRFTLINAHVPPEKAAQEVNVLDDVLLSVRRYEYPEDDVLVAGNLSAEPHQLGQLGAVPGIVSLAARYATDTAGTRAVDHVLIDRLATSEGTGDAGVLSYERNLGLTREQANRVSNHRPVWAAFGLDEKAAGGPVATLPEWGRR